MERVFITGLMDKVKEALGNEENTDEVLGKVGQLGKDKFGEDKTDQIKKVRGIADECLGNKE